MPWDKHKDNIIGCIGDYADMKGAQHWFDIGRKELASEDFAGLINSVDEWLSENLHDKPALAANVLSLLTEFDGDGDEVRRSKLEQVQSEYKRHKEQERVLQSAKLKFTAKKSIIDNISNYVDLMDVRNKLFRWQHKLTSEDFTEVIDHVHKWLLEDLLDRPVFEYNKLVFTDNVLSLVADFDGDGDEVRRSKFEQVQSEYKRHKKELEGKARKEAEKRKEREHKLELERMAEAKRREELEKQRQEEAERREKLNKERRALLGRKLSEDFLGAEALFLSFPDDGILFRDEFEEQKIDVIRIWLADRAEKFGVTIPMDDEQLAAVAAVNGHVKVVARAGSGKTTTLVHRALFLMEHCNVPASSLLLLAFNKKAALEMRRRLLGLMHSEADVQYEIEKGKNKGQRVGIDKIDMEENIINAVAEYLGIVLPHVMTFHALAKRVVRPKETIIYDNDSDGSKASSSVLQKVIENRCKGTRYEAQVRKLMLEHFRENWDHIFNIKFRRNAQNVSLDRKYVKSHGEKLIANFLFEHDIKYWYESNEFWDGINYKPDFKIKNKQGGNGGVIIEYFGLAGSSGYYDKEIQEKRKHWDKKPGWDLIELFSEDINGEESFNELLKSKLEKLGVICNRLSEDEIWSKIRDGIISNFAKAILGFIGRCRKLVLSPDDLKYRIDVNAPLAKVERDFNKLAHKIYKWYLEWLSENGKDDYDGLMQRAVCKIEDGGTIFKSKDDGGDLKHLRYIFVDEFQDFSYLFYKLLDSIRKVNQSVEFFCVGDDWQAINGFAGSDLKYFQHFEEFIGKHRSLYITTNYRSAKSIVEVGNALMDGRGHPAVAYNKTPGIVVVADQASFKLTPVEKEHHNDIITPMVSRIVNASLKSGSDVVMLSRKNAIIEYVNYGDQRLSSNKLTNFLSHIRSLFPEESRNRIGISTTHKYKGLEKSTVIVLDAVDGCYPLIHPNWVFTRVLGNDLNDIIAEERRLLYVALTRAVEKLIIITSYGKESEFLDELQAVRVLVQINWRDYPPVPSQSGKLVIKVGNQKGRDNTYDIKDILKQRYKYKWQPDGWQSWAKILEKGVHIDQWRTESWVEKADGIEVRICDEAYKVTERYLINKGEIFKTLAATTK